MTRNYICYLIMSVRVCQCLGAWVRMHVCVKLNSMKFSFVVVSRTAFLGEMECFKQAVRYNLHCLQESITPQRFA